MSLKEMRRRKRAKVYSVEQFAVLRAAQLWNCPTRKGGSSAEDVRHARNKRTAA